MITFGKHKNITFYLSVLSICLYFSNISFAFLSYQVNQKILDTEKEKYYTQIQQNIKKEKILKEYEAKRKILYILSKYRTGLNQYQLQQTAKTIHYEGKKYGYDPMLLMAIMMTESSFYNKAISRVGARGLMQLMPFTAKEIAYETKLRWDGKKSLYEPDLNVKMGIYYLDKMVDRFGNIQLALEAYNNGPRKLLNMLDRGFLPTRYSNKVFGAYERLKQGRI